MKNILTNSSDHVCVIPPLNQQDHNEHNVFNPEVYLDTCFWHAFFISNAKVVFRESETRYSEKERNTLSSQSWLYRKNSIGDFEFCGSPGFALIRQPYIKLSLGFSRRSGGIL